MLGVGQRDAQRALREHREAVDEMAARAGLPGAVVSAGDCRPARAGAARQRVEDTAVRLSRRARGDRASAHPREARSRWRSTRLCTLLERVLAAQAAQGAVLDRIVAALEAPRRGRLGAGDAALLDAIASHVGPEIVFSAADLWRHAARVDDALAGRHRRGGRDRHPRARAPPAAARAARAGPGAPGPASAATRTAHGGRWQSIATTNTPAVPGPCRRETLAPMQRHVHFDQRARAAAESERARGLGGVPEIRAGPLIRSRRSCTRGHARLVPIAKAAVDAHTTADEGVALQPLTAAFVASVDRQSILGQLDGAQRVPLGVVGRLQTGDRDGHGRERGRGETRGAHRL